MVSGFVTSPCDQLRIFSGDASMMRIASKSVIGLVSSNGFERNKATLLGKPVFRLCRGCSRDSSWILPPRVAVPSYGNRFSERTPSNFLATKSFRVVPEISGCPRSPDFGDLGYHEPRFSRQQPPPSSQAQAPCEPGRRA